MNSLQSHLKTAHWYWEQLLQPGDCVIDATCGNGHDTLKLCELVPEGKVYAFDIQKEAILAAQSKLSEDQLSRIVFVHGCHSCFNVKDPIKLIVYNLGYLPGGDKELTTLVDTTLQSIRAATELVVTGGLISITCYPGHPEGALEEAAILDWVSMLSRFEWNCCHHRWMNKKNAPSLLILQKR